MTAIDCTTEQPSTYRHRVSIGAHELHADLGLAEGGGGSAPDAHDYFDASLATCKALTAMWFAKKNGIALERVDVHVERDGHEERKGRYKLVVRMEYHGALGNEDRVRVHAAAERCPVSKLMTTSEVVIETVPLPDGMR